MFSWKVIMLLFWHYQKLSQLRVKISYDILIDPPHIINDKVLFEGGQNIITIYWPRGQNIVRYIDPRVNI